MIETLLGSFWPALVGILGTVAGGIFAMLAKRQASADVAEARAGAARTEAAAARAEAQAEAANAEAALAGAHKAAEANQAAAKAQALDNDELDALAASLGVLRKGKT